MATTVIWPVVGTEVLQMRQADAGRFSMQDSPHRQTEAGVESVEAPTAETGAAARHGERAAT